MRFVPHPRTGEGMVLLSVFTLLALEVVVLAVAPVRRRGHRAAELVVLPKPPGRVDSSWFGSPVLKDFPADAVRPVLLREHPPDLNQLYVAWVLATHGHDAAWLERHLGLSAEAAEALVTAARAHGAPAAGASDGTPGGPG